RSLVSFEEPSGNDPPAFDAHQPDCSVFIVQRETTGGAGRHKIDFARRQVGDVRTAPTQTMALLRFLLIKLNAQSVPIAIKGKIDFYPISFCHPEAQFFGISA